VSFGLGLDASLIGGTAEPPIGLVAEDKPVSPILRRSSHGRRRHSTRCEVPRVLAGRIAFDLAPP
jgi:hypothetical protein